MVAPLNSLKIVDNIFSYQISIQTYVLKLNKMQVDARILPRLSAWKTDEVGNMQLASL
jgi:hypothetical protein